MPQAFKDRWGSPVFGERQHAVDLLDEAVEQLVSLSGDPAAFADEAAAREPQLVLARVVQAYLALYAGSASGLERARALVGDLDPRGLAAGEREVCMCSPSSRGPTANGTSRALPGAGPAA